MYFPVINWYFLRFFALPMPVPKWVCVKLISLNQAWLKDSLYSKYELYQMQTFIGYVKVPTDWKTWKGFYILFVYQNIIRPTGSSLGFNMPNLSLKHFGPLKAVPSKKED